MLILADTGILLRLVNRADHLHGAVRASVRSLKQRGDALVTAPQNLAEFWNACTRPTAARGGLGLSLAETDKRLRLVERLTHVLPDTSAAYAIWRQMVVDLGVMGVQVHDARLVAFMLAHGVTHLLTLNLSDFQRYTAIVAISP